MSFNTIWNRPEDPDSRSFRWREARRRLAEAKRAEAQPEDQEFREATHRDHPAFTDAGEDLRDIHGYIKGLIYRPLIGAAVLMVAAGLIIWGGSQ